MDKQTEEKFKEQVSSCRMFRKKCPDVDDYVVCKIMTLDDEGADVELLEYNNLKGYMSISQFTRRRTRSIKKIADVGQEHVLLVIGSDKEKMYVDVSKKNVAKSDNDECKNSFIEEKKTHNMLTLLAVMNDMTLTDIYENCAWNLCEHYDKSMFQVFELISEIGEEIFKDVPCSEVTEKVRNDLIDLVQKNFVRTEKRFEQQFQLMCTAENGIEIIKECLMSLDDNDDVHVEIIGSPNYKVAVMAFDQKSADEKLETALNHISSVAEKYKNSTQIEWTKEKEEKEESEDDENSSDQESSE